MRRTMLVTLVLMTVGVRTAHADSDGYYCVGAGYLAWELNDATRPVAAHHLFIIRYGGGAISPKDSVVIPQFQVHGMRCRAEGVDLAGWEATYTVAFGASGTRPTLTSAPLAVAGQMPPWAGGFVSNLAMLSKAFLSLTPETQSLQVEAGVREYLLEITAVPDSVRECSPMVTARVVERDANRREVHAQIAVRWREPFACARTSFAPVVGPATIVRNPIDVILENLLSGVHGGTNVSPYSGQLRAELEEFLRRADSYRTTRPPEGGGEMSMVDWARVSYERILFASAAGTSLSRDSATALAVGYVTSLRPCYEWEGFHDCPEREAKFADEYSAAHPGGPFSAYLPLLAANRWICTAEAYERENRPTFAADSRREYLTRIAMARASASLLVRTAAERMAQLGRCAPPR